MTKRVKKNVIICIDDEQAILNALNSQLKNRFGKRFKYEFAESAEEGLEIIEELAEEGHTIVMVISDQIMPGMTGDKFLVNVHKNHPKPVKVLLTGQAAVESAINAINNANLFRYITKPWEEADFLLTVEKGLQQYELYDELAKTNQELSDTLQVFQRFVPDPIQERVAKEGINQLDMNACDEGMASILFSDLRRFTSVAEVLPPQETLNFLNDVVEQFIPIIHGEKGFINQFVGDALMCIFYEQEAGDADLSLRTAVKMQTALRKFNTKKMWGGDRNISMGIGVNTGPIITGLIGDETRMDAVVIGDTVNISSRLENLTKHYNSDILISRQTWAHLKNPEKFLIRPVDLVRVAGKVEPVEVFEVFNADTSAQIDAKTSISDIYQKALEAFRQGEWREASDLFKRCQQALPDDVIVTMYLSRCIKMEENPPTGHWDGVVSLGKMI